MNFYITAKASAKLWAYVELVNTEIGGFGYAFLEDGDMIWIDTFTVPQIATHGEVDFETTNGDVAAIEKAVSDGVLSEDNFVWVSWHSHHKLGNFWSGTDDKRIKGLGKSGVPYVLSFVGCHDHKYRLRLDMFSVDHNGITIPQVTMDDQKLLLDNRDAVYAEVFAELKTNLREKPKAPTYIKPKSTTDAPGDQLERALTVRALMNSGMDRAQAVAYADALDEEGEEFFVGPSGVMGFDEMAWGDELPDAEVVG